MAKDQLMVGMAELKTAKGPTIFTCIGLGSCVGLAAQDPVADVSGMAHIMLPAAFRDRPVERPAKFADTAIATLFEEMEKLGAERSRIVCAYAGGAQVFQGPSETNRLDVGARNGSAVGQILKSLHANVFACDIGGSQGRTVTFCTETGLIRIRTVTSGERPLCNLRELKLRNAA